MNIQTPERYIGYDQYGLTDAEARRICGKLPRPNHEKLIEHEGQHYWVERVWFKHDHKYRPITWAWAARVTDWRLVGGVAVLQCATLRVPKMPDQHFGWVTTTK